MPRTTSSDVAGIIEVDASITLDPFIDAASALVDKVADADTTADDAALKRIETWLAAHFYTVRDPRAVSEKAGSVGATYQSKVDLNLATSHYGQMAMTLDTSGTLRRLSSGATSIGVTWAGTDSDA